MNMFLEDFGHHPQLVGGLMDFGVLGHFKGFLQEIRNIKTPYLIFLINRCR